MARFLWSGDDLAFLRDQYPMIGPRGCSARLGASYRCVVTKASREGIEYTERCEVGRNGTLSERFERKYIPEPNSGCWLWVGSQDRAGYGQIREPSGMRVATHVALELAGRPVPSGLYACHHCDNKSCVNPDHLFIGTAKDNAQDAKRKGLLSPPPIAKKGQGMKTHCHMGHSLSGYNLYVSPKGHRGCRACKQIAKKRRRLAICPSSEGDA